MKREFKMEYCLGNYATGSFSLRLCADKLSDLFDLSDNPEHITFVLSDKPTEHAYFVKPDDPRRYYPVAMIKLSNGRWIKKALYVSASIILREYPDGVWMSVYA